MATNEQLAKAKEEAAKQLIVLFDMNVKEAALRANLGDVNFSAAIPSIDRVLDLFGMLRGVSLDYFSFQKLTLLKTTIDEAINLFKQIQAFTLSVENPSAQRDAIAKNLENNYEAWFDKLHPLIAFAVRSATDFAALETNLRQKIAQAEVTSGDLLKQQQEAAKKATDTLTAIQKTAAEAGVSREAVYFKSEADAHDAVSKGWLKATIAMSVATVVWGLIVLWVLVIPADAKAPQIIQQAIGKLIVLGGLYYGLMWCARNYGANKHNVIVNRHRQNALSTFETFVKAASSDDVKQAVLLQATTSIFANQVSGYTGKEGDQDQPSKVIEILRSASAALKPGVAAS